jgi:hypothetical protein
MGINPVAAFSLRNASLCAGVRVEFYTFTHADIVGFDIIQEMCFPCPAVTSTVPHKLFAPVLTG